MRPPVKPQHGDVLPLLPGEMPAGGATCDWGDCDEPVAFYRFDAYGHGWLGVCAACARKPVETTT